MEDLRLYFNPQDISCSWRYPSEDVDGLVDVTDLPDSEVEALFDAP